MADRLDIRGVGKRYGSQTALDELSLSVAPGERVALLGHNGAGKTTLMKLILGLTHPDEGRIDVFDAAPGSAEARATTAYLPESAAFHRALTGREQLTLFARLAGAPAREVPELLDRVGLADAAGRRIGGWSKGMRQRLGLAQVLLGRPKAALLDEPTSGLDPIARHHLYDIIDEMAARGVAVLISSHALTEVEARTDRIAILRKGRLIADDTLTRLSAKARLPVKLRVTAKSGDGAVVHDRFGGQRVNCAAVEIFCQADEKMERLAAIAALGDIVSDIDVTPPSLEDLYRHYSEEGRT